MRPAWHDLTAQGVAAQMDPVCEQHAVLSLAPFEHSEMLLTGTENAANWARHADLCRVGSWLENVQHEQNPDAVVAAADADAVADAGVDRDADSGLNDDCDLH